VMVTRTGDVKVMDFGIARSMNDSQATMTQTAQVIGTAQYLSPEQARGERVDARSDLYSTGCLMYELLTGRPPFTGDSPVAIPPSRLDPDIPPWADAIVLKAMAKAPSDRYQSAAEMKADIQRAASGMQVAASMQPPTRVDYYDYQQQQRTQQMGPQTMMGAAPTSISQYPPQGGYPTGYNDNGGYDGGDQGQQRGSRRWLPWLIAGIVVVAAIIVAVLLLDSNKGGGSFVPASLNNETQALAVQQIKAAGLVPNVINKTDSQVAKGLVITSSPAEGSSIAKGGTVTITVSSGTANIKLPDVSGMQYTQAQQKLIALGFTNVTQGTDTSSTLPSGEVARMSPNPGSSYSPNTAITLYTSGGGLQIPNVIGLPQASAIQLLKTDGFTSTPSVTDSVGPAGTQPGTVWAVTPNQGTTQTPGTQITLTVQPNATASASPSASASPTGTPTTSPTPSVSPTPTATDTGTGTPTPDGGGGGGFPTGNP
jgi:beta-lactam-binding protein with PASTA domain